MRVLKLMRVLSDKVLFRLLSNRTFLRFLSDRVLSRVLSDRVLFDSSVIGSSSGSSVIDSSCRSSVLFFRFVALFYKNVVLHFQKKAPDVLFYIIFSKRSSHWTISLTFLIISTKMIWKNTCMIETQNVILEICVANFPIYK